jgi:CDGSH-type Zn-finger protein
VFKKIIRLNHIQWFFFCFLFSGEVAHIRDCSDDKTFDFNEISNNKSSYARLIGLRDNNETACVYDGQNTVCLSKCGHSENMTDFCNGPQYGSTTTAVFSKIMFMTILFCYVLFNPWFLHYELSS